MARNEEKQLGRLNRFYLQQQKEEELKKRPPRPRLETLSTLDDVKKWIPSILKDIEFYVKQMEVSCYPKKTIEEFERRINQLRGEYKRFVRKAHELEPDLDSTPWSDRPYSRKRQKFSKDESCTEAELAPSSITDAANSSNQSRSINFVPLSTPVLDHLTSFREFYGARKSDQSVLPEVDTSSQDQPLDFNFTASKEDEDHKLCSKASSITDNGNSNLELSGPKTCENNYLGFTKNSGEENGAFNVVTPSQINTANHKYPVNQSLNLPYSDSSSDEGT